jgi:hypothetical protein
VSVEGMIVEAGLVMEKIDKEVHLQIISELSFLNKIFALFLTKGIFLCLGYGGSGWKF